MRSRWMKGVLVGLLGWGMFAGPLPDLHAEGEPEVVSPSVIVMDAGSGQVLFEKNARERRPPASMTKLMTLLLSVQAMKQGRVRMSTPVLASENAVAMGGSQIWLERGEQIPFGQLVKSMAIGSANDACVAIAEHLYGTEGSFVAGMNREAKRLGMRDTHYANSHGLDADDHLTTAYDMALLSRAAVQEPEVLKFTSMREDRTVRNGKGGFLWLVNHNRLLAFYPGMDGLKTGFTNKAGFCLTATARRDATRLIAVVMGAPTSKERFADATTLLNWGFAAYRSVPVLKEGQVLGVVPVTGGMKPRIAIRAQKTVTISVRQGGGESLTTRVVLPERIDAPVRQGQEVGQVIVRQGKTVVATIPLTAEQTVEKATFGRIAGHLLHRTLTRPS